MEEIIASLDCLYERLIPALKSKELEMHQNHMIYITKKDIWNFFYHTKWKKGNDLTLADLVDDILNTDNFEIDEYVRKERGSKYESEN